MKKMIAVMFVGLLILAFVGIAGAVQFSDLMDFDAQLKRERTATRMHHGASPVTLSHEIPSGDEISFSEAMLNISHMGNKASKRYGSEVYLVTGTGEEYCLGELSNSKRRWVDQEFFIPEELLEGLGEESFSVQIRSHKKRGKLWLDRILLTGNYEHNTENPGAPPVYNAPVGESAAPVPEPATMLLFGVGLAGLAAFGRKFRNQLS